MKEESHIQKIVASGKKIVQHVNDYVHKRTLIQDYYIRI